MCVGEAAVGEESCWAWRTNKGLSFCLLSTFCYFSLCNIRKNVTVIIMMAALCSGLWGEVCCAWHHLLYILFHLAVIITVNPLMFDIPSVRQQIVLLLESSQQNTATQRNWMNTICTKTRGQSNLRKSASRGAHSPVRGHPRVSKFVPLNSWGRVSY